MTAIKKNPLEVTSREEFYARIEEGLDDVENGRTRPLEDVMRDVFKLIDSYDVQS